MTRFDSPAEFARAEAHMRQVSEETGIPAPTVPITDIFGADQPKLSGIHLDPADPSQFREVDFAGGTVFASYRTDANGDL